MSTSDLRIAGVRRGTRVTFRFDGQDIEGFEGEAVAAALWAAGVRAPANGDAQEAPPARTLCCAMGVCQQCALWIDGCRVESCRVAVRAGLEASSTPSPRPVPDAQRRADDGSFDVVVLGAGPAGGAAAIEAQALGLRVVVIDENPAAGGQVYRVAPGIEPQQPDRDRVDGHAMRAQLQASSVPVRSAQRVWHVERTVEGWRVHTVGAETTACVKAAALIVATGAHERQLPFPGWEKTGVIGLAAATILLKSQRVLPGRRVLVAGSGPLLLAVAKGIVEGGGRVAAIVDANPRRAWLSDIAALASRPDLTARGAGWLTTLLTRRVPMLHAHRLQRVVSNATGLQATVLPVEREGAFRAGASPVDIDCDAVCCGYGLMPATDVTRLVGAAHVYDAARGGWHVRVDDDQRCDLPRLYAAGDVAGVTGAAAAPWQGRIAALAAAADLGRVDARTHASRFGEARRARGRASCFGAAMTALCNIGDAAVASIPADTIVCQCEHLTRAALEVAIDDGCVTLNDLRSATRCGMGPCGGRLCEDAVARLIAMRTGRTRADIGQPTGRPPLRPVDLDTLAGEFDYDALPIAAPSPL